MNAQEENDRHRDGVADARFGAAIAQETVKIGYIDPLSGGGASVGEVGFKTFQFLAEELNAKGGILGKKVEIVPSTTRPIRRKA